MAKKALIAKLERKAESTVECECVITSPEPDCTCGCGCCPPKLVLWYPDSGYVKGGK